MAPEHEFKYEPTTLRCHGCMAVARASEEFSAKPRADTRGLMIGVHLKGGGHG